MRYVTEVNYGWTRKRGSAIVSPFETTGGTVKVRDTVKRGTEVVNIRTSDVDFLGLGVDMEDGTGVAVKHTLKTANLHNHIVSAETRICTPILSADYEDLIILCAGSRLTYREGTSGVAAALNMQTDIVKCLGLSGSVVTRQASPCDIPAVMTLYDLLGGLCLESRMNLLTYEVLRIYAPDRRYETVIRLSRTKQSQRFFTKMYFDITGRAK